MQDIVLAALIVLTEFHNQRRCRRLIAIITHMINVSCEATFKNVI